MKRKKKMYAELRCTCPVIHVFVDLRPAVIKTGSSEVNFEQSWPTLLSIEILEVWTLNIEYLNVEVRNLKPWGLRVTRQKPEGSRNVKVTRGGYKKEVATYISSCDNHVVISLSPLSQYPKYRHRIRKRFRFTALTACQLPKNRLQVTKDFM